MNSLHRRWMQNRLAALHRGEISGGQRAALERHLAVCVQCRKSLESYAALDTSLVSACPQAALLAPDRAQAILAAALADRSLPSRRSAGALAGVCLAGTLGAGLLLWIRLQPEPEVCGNYTLQANDRFGANRLPVTPIHQQKSTNEPATVAIDHEARTRLLSPDQAQHPAHAPISRKPQIRRIAVYARTPIHLPASLTPIKPSAMHANLLSSAAGELSHSEPAKGHLVVLASGTTPRIPVTVTSDGPSEFGFAKVTGFAVNEQGTVLRNQCTVREARDTDTLSTLQRDAVTGRRVSSLTVEATSSAGETANAVEPKGRIQ